MKKLLVSIFFILGFWTICFGQSSFQGLTPGTSTRDQVNRVLGPPVNADGGLIADHTPPAGISKVVVEYGAGSSLVERIEVYFLKPISRSALIKKLDLKSFMNTPRPDAQGKSQGKLVEYFVTPMLSMTYQSADASGGVSQIGYYSEALFGKVLEERMEKGEAQVIDITEEEKSTPPALTGVYGEITGVVKLRTSGGSLKPVAGAAVDFYRTDGLPGQLKSRTDKHGFFVVFGLSQTASWVVIASGPGMKWAYVSGVRTPLAGLEIVAEPGDGVRPTWEEVKANIR